MTEIATALAVLSLFAGPAARDWRPRELVVAPQRIDRYPELQRLAFRYLGRPYSMGGVGSPAFDCSGFVCRVYAEAGYPLPRVSRDQVRAGAPVDLEALLPGDLLFFADPGRPISHVGIYLGGGEMVHASSTHGEVTVSDLGARWFRQRLVAARRVLTSTAGATPGPAFAEVEPRELVEHDDSPLLPMLRRPPRRPPPSFGPELTGEGETSIGLRSALLTERGVLGVTLVPEGTLALDSIALAISLAVPIRFELKETPSVGTFHHPGDYARFLRSASLGLPGADLELSFSRLGDYRLAGGFLVRRLAPGSQAGGIAGLSVETSPLTFYGAVRTDVVRLEGLIDDVFAPAITGAGAVVPLLDRLELGAAYVTDQKAGAPDRRRAMNGVEADLKVRALDRTDVSLDVSLAGAGVEALAAFGFGGTLSVDGEYRFGAYDSAIGLVARGGWLGPGMLSELFGPTYPADRAAHLEALARVRGRPVVGGELTLRLGRVTVGGVFESGVGPHRDALDQIVEALVEVQGLRLGGTHFLDLRGAYASRSLFRDEPRVDVLFGSVRLRYASWLFFELYLKEAGTLEGGGGVTITWIP